MSKNISVVIVEDEPLFAELLTKTLAGHPDISIVGTYLCATAALDRMDLMEVAVVDIDLGSGPDGVDVVHRWREINPDLGVVFLSNLRDPSVLLTVAEVPGAGMAYLHKRTAVGVDALVDVIRSVARGEVLVDPVLTRELPESGSSRFALTAHQERILRMIATGASNKRISDELGIPIKSVENATAGALRSLGIDGSDPKINVRVTAAMTYIRLIAGAN